MKLPNFRRIFSSDFKDEFKQVMDQLGILFNGALDPVYNALNNNLTFGDNFAATVAEFTVAVNSRGEPIQTTTLRLSNKQTTVSGIIVIKANGLNNSTILPSAGVYVDGKLNGNTITISNVKGIPQDIQFRIKAVILA
jgi:hypothetical protein